MSAKTRNPILAALVAGLSVSLAAPMALAQGGPQNCIILPDGTRQCAGAGPQGQPGGQPPRMGQQPGQPQQWGPQQGQPPRMQPGQPPQGQPPRMGMQPGEPQRFPGAQFGQPDGRPGPMPGASARRAPVFQQARDSRLPPPPAHQHYRVMNGTIVRVDNDTLRVVAVVGLLSAILNSR